MQKLTAILIAAIVLPTATTLTSCRGEISKQPPIHIVPNMDWQDRFAAQSESNFAGWADNRGMRTPVANTIARDSLKLHSADPRVVELNTYKVGEEYVKTNPVTATAEVLARGRDRFNINCSVCHAYNGRGKGILNDYLPIPRPSFMLKGNPEETATKPDIIEYADGRLFETITNGFSTMKSYANHVSVEDRWAIVHYIRALQYRAYH